MKITDRDIKSILKVFTPTEILKKYIDGGIRLTSKQLDKLIEMKSGLEHEQKGINI